MEEIREILQTIAQSTLATASAAEAVKKAVEDKKSSTPGWSKQLAKPNMLSHKKERLRHSESGHGYLRNTWVQLMRATWKTWKRLMTSQTRSLTWCMKLYGLIASRMRGRALQLVKAADDPNGFDAWRSLIKALKPTSKASGLRSGSFGSNNYMARIFNEQCTTTSTSEACRSIWWDGQGRDDNSRRVEICYSFEMCRLTAQIIVEFDDWRQCSILNFEGTSVAMGLFSAEVGYFHGGK